MLITNNKLMVHSQNTTIFTYNTFTINKIQLHVSAINGGHLQVVHEALNDKLYPPLMAETCSCTLLIVNVL
jgi:hypothetical protein